jgi:DNA-binding transcriptional MerR regulator
MDALKTIGEAADATGLTEDTLRYYEKIGVLFDVDRTSSGHRRYSDATISWLGLVVRLRSTGMALETIQRYAELARQGHATISQRRDILTAHKVEIEREAERLADLGRVLTEKIAKYDQAVALGFDALAPCEPLALDRAP